MEAQVVRETHKQQQDDMTAIWKHGATAQCLIPPGLQDVIQQIMFLKMVFASVAKLVCIL
uniref:Uncharacterized protein n=1 Tax=Nelumbo nucifera TaxID=4432 RepID=A0A822Z225_NELNU|nr:TPA_asm: hypothetical protein HUJ06_008126 [Nelumbo nucifera]